MDYDRDTEFAQDSYERFSNKVLAALAKVSDKAPEKASPKGKGPKLQNSDASELLKLIDKLAFVGQNLYFDFDGLLQRLRAHSMYHTPPVLNDLYDECADFFRHALLTTRACNKYMACCCRFYDPNLEIEGLSTEAEPKAAYDDFLEQYETLRQSTVKVDLCWEETGPLIEKELQDLIGMPPGFEWLLWVESVIGFGRSQLLGLRDDVPTLVKRARAHWGIFGQHYDELRMMINQIESARVGACNAKMTQGNARDVAAEGFEWIPKLLRVFAEFILGLSSIEKPQRYPLTRF
ncbi:hypothetical protein DFH06DRAFT_1206749 [Mycena polygramma]|nr:hypothetical protein DFH06DRAFT_1206749 [Mycena polygramma]